jgi:hypothetical protein
MNFRTEINVKPTAEKIDLAKNILTIGSCFADAIGSRMASHKFKCQVNPFGNLFNPESIHKALRYALDIEQLNSRDLLSRDGTSFHFDFHSEISGPSSEDLLGQLKERTEMTGDFLNHTDFIVLTYGTAWVYRRQSTNETVANCHKVNASEFKKSLLSVDEIVASFEQLRKCLLVVNPKIKFILTISPVRHVKDTLSLNSVSKSVLRVACHEISEKSAEVEYFPAYEMMMDDLRDYRFYKKDMLHPTEQAEDYIWGKFTDQYFTEEAKAFVKKWDAIQSALSHRPFHPKSSSHQQFLIEIKSRLDELKTVVDVSNEMAQLNQQIDL